MFFFFVNFFFKLMVQLKGLTCHAHIVIAHIVTEYFDHRANNYTLKLTVWKHLRDDVFSVWTHNTKTHKI